MRRYRNLVLAGLLALVAVGSAWCGGRTEQAGDDQNKEVTLRFYFFGEAREKTNEVWKTIAEKYDDALHAKFEIGFIPGSEYSQKLIAMAASGDDYDMNFDGDWLAYSQMVTNGAYLDITDLLPRYAPDLYKVYQGLNVLEAASVNGRIVSLPWTMAMNQRPYFAWNANYADNAGVTIKPENVKTFEDIDVLLSRLYAAYPDKWIAGSVNPEAVYAKYELASLGFHNLVYSLNDPAHKILPFEQTQAYVDRARWAKKWNDAGYIPKDAVNEQYDGNTLLSEEILLTHFTWHEWADKLGKLEGAAAYSELYPDSKYANRTPLANVMAINVNAANPERTLMFLNLVETDRAMYDLVQYGIEGVTYKLDGDVANYAVAGMNSANSNYMEWGGQWALWKPQFIRPNATYPTGFWEKEAELAGLPKNVNAPLNGFFPSSDSITNELAQRDQIWALDKLIAYGAVDNADAAVTEMINKQKAAGVDKIVAEVQRQVDAFFASQK